MFALELSRPFPFPMLPPLPHFPFSSSLSTTTISFSVPFPEALSFFSLSMYWDVQSGSLGQLSLDQQ